jgi:hypothetical protein
MDKWEKRIAAASLDLDRPQKILKRDMKAFKELREQNAKLREEVRKLNKNNEKFIKLVELLETKIKTLTEDVNKQYVYSYEKGGWIEKGSLDKGKIEVAPSQLNIDTINNQLAEILRMIERHRIKER